MGIMDISDRDLAYILSFSTVEVHYLCPIRFLLYIQLRMQEVRLIPTEVVVDVLSPLL
jgi:hypothetical protein